MTPEHSVTESKWDQFAKAVGLISGVLLAISEILGCLRNSPYRGLIQSLIDICSQSYNEGKINFTLPRTHSPKKPPDVETPSDLGISPGTPGSTNSGTPTVGTITSYFALAPPQKQKTRLRNQY